MKGLKVHEGLVRLKKLQRFFPFSRCRNCTPCADVGDLRGISLGAGVAHMLCVLVYRTPLGTAVIGCAIEVHRQLGPGLLESSYGHGFGSELKRRGLKFERERAMPVQYKDEVLDFGYRIDFLIESELGVEIKAVERFMPIHTAQVLTYLKLLNLPQGLLINFNVKRLVQGGIKSILLGGYRKA